RSSTTALEVAADIVGPSAIRTEITRCMSLSSGRNTFSSLSGLGAPVGFPQMLTLCPEFRRVSGRCSWSRSKVIQPDGVHLGFRVVSRSLWMVARLNPFVRVRRILSGSSSGGLDRTRRSGVIHRVLVVDGGSHVLVTRSPRHNRFHC